MPVPDTSGVPPFADFDALKSKLNEIVQKYNNLLVNLDTLNIVSLNAQVIEAGSITGDKIAANTITANKMDVEQLSAIAADLGTITAGLIQSITIIGSYIATASGSYPRCEMSASDNLFAAYQDANNYVRIVPEGNTTNAPTIEWASSGSDAAQISTNDTDYTIQAFGRNMNLTTDTSGNISLLPAVASSVILPSLFAILLNNSGLTMQDYFDEKADNFTGASGTVYVATTPGGAANTAISFSGGIRTS